MFGSMSIQEAHVAEKYGMRNEGPLPHGCRSAARLGGPAARPPAVPSRAKQIWINTRMCIVSHDVPSPLAGDGRDVRQSSWPHASAGQVVAD